MKDELIELVGDYDSVEIRAKGIQVQVSRGTMGNLKLPQKQLTQT